MNDDRRYHLISADSHVLEPPDIFERSLASGLRSRAPKLEAWNGGSAWRLDGREPITLPASAVTGSGYESARAADASAVAFDDVLPALYDPVERIRAQDADSVDAEVLYPTSSLWDAVRDLDDRDVQIACIRAYNDWIAEFCATDPARLVGVAKVPSTSVEDAREELLRCAKELNLRGVMLDAWPSGGSAGNPADDPFWDAVNETGVPVSLHYALGAHADTSPPVGIAPGLKPPMADAVLPLVSAGVFDRFPNVRLVLAHADAGWAFHWLEFLDINYVRHKHLSEYALPDPDSVPSDYMRRYSWFTFHHDRSSVRNRNLLGSVHLMWGSYFYLEECNWPYDRQQAMQVTEEVPEADKSALLVDNVARLYRMPGYEQGFDEGEVREFEQLVHF